MLQVHADKIYNKHLFLNIIAWVNNFQTCTFWAVGRFFMMIMLLHVIVVDGGEGGWA